MTSPVGWKSTTLSQFVDLQRGFDLPSHKRVPGRYKVISSGKSSGSHNEGPVKGPGFAIGRATNLGRPTWSDDDYWPLNTVLFVKSFRDNDPKFAYYIFENLDLSGYNSGSVQPMLNRNHIANVEIQIPDVPKQREIAATLSALDNRIGSNRRIVELVPRLVAAHVAKSLSRDSESIPITRLAQFVNGGAYTKGASGAGRMVLRIAELNSGPGNSTVYNDIEVPDEKTARAGDLLMSWSGTLGVYRWFRHEAIINQHIFKVIPTGFPGWLVFDRLEAAMPVFRGIAKDKATTMGHIQRGHLESTTVSIPLPEEIERLDAALGPLWERLLLTERENVKLAALRDALLPLLLSGRIHVPEAEEVLA
ncbi:restriction endonuclease subunit S [Glaciihabitans sp. UYNi722]|uniref:restriction endonuclease subunit S n=1 Tax=Glaciihabitans sp. UYNi722 TaxID=3156344 RepID=UPI0033933F91